MQRGFLVWWQIVLVVVLVLVGLFIYKTGWHCDILLKINNPCYVHVDPAPVGGDFVVDPVVTEATETTSSGREDNIGRFCAQVITFAREDSTRECQSFSTPCNVPKGWTQIPGDQCN